MTVEQIQNRLTDLADPVQAGFLQRYFKTGPGQYGEGDVFRGIRVPELRKVGKAAKRLSLDQAEELLHSRWHEDRLTALLILVEKSAKADEALRQALYDLYLRNTRFINNWDLVDVSAGHIIGGYLIDKSHDPLDHLAASASLWERRISIMATFLFIRRGSVGTTLRVAEKLVGDREDLIHKAVGWMVREAAKQDLPAAEEFLIRHCRTMPRTMLRYAIEKFPQEKRLRYLKGDV